MIKIKANKQIVEFIYMNEIREKNYYKQTKENLNCNHEYEKFDCCDCNYPELIMVFHMFWNTINKFFAAIIAWINHNVSFITPWIIPPHMKDNFKFTSKFGACSWKVTHTGIISYDFFLSLICSSLASSFSLLQHWSKYSQMELQMGLEYFLSYCWILEQMYLSDKEPLSIETKMMPRNVALQGSLGRLQTDLTAVSRILLLAVVLQTLWM